MVEAAQEGIKNANCQAIFSSSLLFVGSWNIRNFNGDIRVEPSFVLKGVLVM